MNRIFDLPPDLDRVADQWRSHISENVAITMSIDTLKHVAGTTSAYVLKMLFTDHEQNCETLFYAGQSGQPAQRAALHKSELKNCKTTTRIGKSKIYSAEFMENVQAVHLDFSVHTGGLSLEDAKLAEREISLDLERQFAGKVLTRPRGKAQQQVLELPQ